MVPIKEEYRKGVREEERGVLLDGPQEDVSRANRLRLLQMKIRLRTQES
jgi:hypothetical protein